MDPPAASNIKNISESLLLSGIPFPFNAPREPLPPELSIFPNFTCNKKIGMTSPQISVFLNNILVFHSACFIHWEHTVWSSVFFSLNCAFLKCTRTLPVYSVNLLHFCTIFHCQSLHTLYICSPANKHVGCLQVAVLEALLLRTCLYTDTHARHSLEFLPMRGTSESPSAFQHGAKWISKATVPMYSAGSKGWVSSLLAYASTEGFIHGQRLLTDPKPNYLSSQLGNTSQRVSAFDVSVWLSSG